MNEVRIEADAPNLKPQGRLRKLLCCDAGNSEVDGEAGEVEAVVRHMPSDAAEMLIVLGRSVAGDDIDLAAGSKAVFDVAEEVDYFDVDRFHHVRIMASEEILDTTDLALIVFPAQPVTCVESFSGVDIEKP